jgi:methylthioribose-1-phosphate isomerase
MAPRRSVTVPTLVWRNGAVRLIDQTRLPEEYRVLTIRTPAQMWKAIKRLSVRGAPAIGCAAAYGVVLGVQKSRNKSAARFLKQVKKVSQYLATSRPTAVNLFWALERMEVCAEAQIGRAHV